MFFMRIKNRKVRIALGILLIPGVIVIDLIFSGHPALSIGIFVAAVVVIAVASRLIRGRFGSSTD